ncbi:MAG: ROK family protein [Chloroflexi bacterium]|jgi:fructokinase|nr:ROK family protein [Chloroflexota bacterium]
MKPLYGGIEAGGTKFVCAVASGPDDIRAEERFPTTTPEETIARALAFFEQQGGGQAIQAVGIASFGPIDPDPRSPTFGYVTNTPKPHWAHTDFAGAVRRALGVPVGFDTDVNVAALGEGRWGAAQGLDTFIYLTIGTGIGGGAVINGELAHGLMHPEMGHTRIPHDWQADPFPGSCSVHGDCWEGLAAGPALEARWKQRGETLPPDHPAWALEADYLAYGVSNLVLVLSPQRVIMGGGVMEQAHLFPMVRRRVQEILNGYVKSPALLEEIDSYIVPPLLGNRAGVLGAIALAERAAQRATAQRA